MSPSRRRFPQVVESRAQELLNSTKPGQPPVSAAEIARRLEAELGAGRLDGREPLPTPTDRTVLDWIARGVIRPDAEDRPWLFTDLGPDEARLVAETIEEE